MFENFNFENFWRDSKYAIKQYVSESITDEIINKTESELGYKLPESYIFLMKQHNGGIPHNKGYLCPNGKIIEIEGILGIGDEKPNSLCGELGSKFLMEEWGYPNRGIAICTTPSGGHDMIFLDYTECGPKGEPKVVHVDQEKNYKITFVANNFE